MSSSDDLPNIFESDIGKMLKSNVPDSYLDRKEKEERLEKVLGQKLLNIYDKAQKIDVEELYSQIGKVLEDEKQLEKLKIKKKEDVTSANVCKILNDVSSDLGKDKYDNLIKKARDDWLLEKLGKNELEEIKKEAKSNNEAITSKIKSVIGSSKFQEVNNKTSTPHGYNRLYKALGEVKDHDIRSTINKVEQEVSRDVDIELMKEVDLGLKKLLRDKTFNYINNYLKNNYGNSIKDQKFLKKNLYKLLKLEDKQPIDFKEFINDMNENDLGNLIDLIHCCCNNDENLKSYEINSRFDKGISYYNSKDVNFIQSVVRFAEKKLGIDFKNPKESILKKFKSIMPGSNKDNKKPEHPDNLVSDFTSSLLTPAFSPGTVFSVFSVASLIGLSSIVGPLMPAVIAIYTGIKAKGLISSDDGKEGTIHNHFSKDDYVRLVTKNDGRVNFQDMVNNPGNRKADYDKENVQGRSKKSRLSNVDRVKNGGKSNPIRL